MIDEEWFKEVVEDLKKAFEEVFNLKVRNDDQKEKTGYDYGRVGRIHARR